MLFNLLWGFCSLHSGIQQHKEGIYILETLIIVLVVIAAVGVTSFCVYKAISKKVKDASRALFGTDSLTEGIKKQDLEYAQTPKSVSSTEPGALPRISRDFPELDISKLKAMNTAKVMKVLNAIENSDTNAVSDEAEQVQEFVRGKVDDAVSSATKINYENIKIHKCVINRYNKSSDKASVIFQTALEYIYFKSSAENGGAIIGEKKKLQSRITTEWVYWLASSNFDATHTVHATCPSCGAPITNIGEKFCQYCGTAVVIDFKKTWEFNNIKEE